MKKKEKERIPVRGSTLYYILYLSLFQSLPLFVRSQSEPSPVEVSSPQDLPAVWPPPHQSSTTAEYIQHTQIEIELCILYEGV